MSSARVPMTPRSSAPSTFHSRQLSKASLKSREERSILNTLASVRKAPRPSNILEEDDSAGCSDASGNDGEDDVGQTTFRAMGARAGVSARAGPSRASGGGAGMGSGGAGPLDALKRRAGKEREAPGDRSFSIQHEASFRDRPLSSRMAPLRPAYRSPVKLGQDDRGDLMDQGPPSRPSNLAGRPVPLEVQEAMVLSDLLSVLLGIEGELVTFDPSYEPGDELDRIQGPRWVVDELLDPGLASVLKRILPLATDFVAVEAFVDSRCEAQYGKVNHALAGGLRGMLQEYHVLITQLEHLFLTSSTFTLQKAFFHLHPTIHTLSLLHALCTALYLADDTPESDDEPDEDESSVDEEAARLGLGGDALKEMMQEAGAGAAGGGGLVKGGEVLSLIWDMGRNMSGDPTAKALFSTLLLHASQPYAEMLVDWISSGRLTDVFDEFLVKEAGSITKKQLDLDFTDEYWERRYTLRDGSTVTQSFRGQAPTRAGVPLPRKGTEGTAHPRLPGGACVPRFLEPWKHKILLAGKYVNVLRECGAETAGSGSEGGWRVKTQNGRGMIDLEDEKFHLSIERAYIHANQTLLKMLIEEQDLISLLRSLKHHFLLCHSSFITHFLDLSLPELSKSSKSASTGKLQSLLDLTLRTSSPVPDKYKDDVRVVLAGERLYELLSKVVNQSGEMGEARSERRPQPKREGEKKRELYAYEAFQLDYAVPFPLSLVVSRKTIARYQILFRLVLQLKHAEVLLGAMWMEHTAGDWRARAGAGGAGALDAWRRRVFVLRAKMLAFVQQMMAFVSMEVLEPNWTLLELKLGKVTTVDQLLADHVDFLDTCLKESALTRTELIDITAKLVQLIQNFCSQSKSFTVAVRRGLAFSLSSTSLPSGGRGQEEEDGGDEDPKAAERSEVLRRYERNFEHNLRVHIETVTYHGGSDNTALLPLVIRLNSLLQL